MEDASQHKLEHTVDDLSSALDSALNISDVPPDVLMLLQEARGIMRSCAALTRGRGSKGARPRADALPQWSDDALELPPPPPPPEPLQSRPTFNMPQSLKFDFLAEGTLDPIEREEREMAARRAQFALGAAEDFENIDWSASAAGASDDEGDSSSCPGGGESEGDGAAEAAAAARLLDDARHALGDSVREEEEPEPSSWEDVPGYVPPGTEGFSAFAREQMRLAGVPSNPRVLPANELQPATWVGQPSKPKLQPYQETVAYICRPQSLRNPRMLVVHRTGSGKTATMIRKLFPPTSNACTRDLCARCRSSRPRWMSDDARRDCRQLFQRPPTQNSRLPDKRCVHLLLPRDAQSALPQQVRRLPYSRRLRRLQEGA